MDSVEIKLITPGSITFEFRNQLFEMGGEASQEEKRTYPDYTAFTSSVVHEGEFESVTFSAADRTTILAGLKKEMEARGMTIAFLP